MRKLIANRPHRRTSITICMAITSLLLLATGAPVGAQVSDRWAPLGTGEHNAITDVPGIKVGQHTAIGGDFLTGVTVVIAEGVDINSGNRTRPGAVGGAQVLGGWPATREVDILNPTGRAPRANAVLLTGGSTFGLDAAGGVMAFLEETEGLRPPSVPGAVIFDLNRLAPTRPELRPGPEFGYQAAASATDGPVEQGVVGAGTGATIGGLKGGVGTASAELPDGIFVGAIAVTNAIGAAIDPRHCGLFAEFLEVDNEFANAGYQRPAPEDCTDNPSGASAFEPEDEDHPNTTIGVVATNARLTPAEAHKMAEIAHSGLARGVRPINLISDGDAIFALATGDCVEPTQTSRRCPSQSLPGSQLNLIYSAAADAFSRAVAHSVLNAETVDRFTSYCDRYPSACSNASANADAAFGAASHTADGHVLASAYSTSPEDSRSESLVPWIALLAVVVILLLGNAVRRPLVTRGR